MISPSRTAARDFVDSSARAVPRALVDRVRAVLDAQSGDARSAAVCLIAASQSLLAGVIARREAGREVALDLLAADACVTWAFELEAGGPDQLSQTAEGAMSTIAALAK